MKLNWSLSSFRQIYVRSGICALSAVGMAMSLFAWYQAGCAGDVKSMAFGDVERALQLEGTG